MNYLTTPWFPSGLARSELSLIRSIYRESTKPAVRYGPTGNSSAVPDYVGTRLGLAELLVVADRTTFIRAGHGGLPSITSSPLNVAESGQIVNQKLRIGNYGVWLLYLGSPRG